MIIISKTWLHPLIPNEAVQLAGHASYRQDRNEVSGKGWGRGWATVHIQYLNKNWCTNSRIIANHCSPNLEAMPVLCRPFYLPCEITSLTISAVYIPPSANVSTSLAHLLTMVNEQQRRHPEGVHIVAGDFNRACLRTVLPGFVQHVRHLRTLRMLINLLLCLISVSQIICHCYWYRHTPPLWRPCTRAITTWSDNALSQLQDCFDRTDWDLFSLDDVGEHTVTVLTYIKHCVDSVTVERYTKSFPNQKPWMSAEVKRLLKRRDSALWSGDKEQYSLARAELKRSITEAKEAYKRWVEGHLTDNNTRRIWQGINVLPTTKAAPTTLSLQKPHWRRS